MDFQALILALIPFIGWGTGDIFGTIASRKIGSYLTTSYQFIFGIILCTFILPFVWNDLSKITFGLLVFNILIGTLYVIANFFVNEGFKESSAPIVGIIIQSFPAIVLILSALIFNDPISSRQIIWVVLVFIGVLLCSLDIKLITSSKFNFDRGIKFALAATTIFALYFTFFRNMANQYGWFLPNYISFLTLPIALLFAKKFIKGKTELVITKNRKMLLIAAISSLLIRSGDIALNLGISKGLAAIVTPIAGAAPVLFIVTSAFVLKDKVSKQQIVGILIALVGIVGLSFLL